jgi:UDP-glucose 4-epimerase
MSKASPGKSGINLGSGREVSINKIAQIAIGLAATDKKLRPIHVEARPLEVRRLLADISKARKLLRFEPRIDVVKGMRLLVKWYKNYRSEVWTY